MKKIVISLEQIDWSVPCRDVWNMSTITSDKIDEWLESQIKSMEEYDEPVGYWDIHINRCRICNINQRKTTNILKEYERKCKEL